MPTVFDPHKVHFQGLEFDSVDEFLLHIAKITGRLNRDLNKQQLNLSNGATWNGNNRSGKQKDYSTVVSVPGQTSVYFKNLESKLVSLIQEADVVVGCVAWLSSKHVLRALANKVATSIIVQKEDFCVLIRLISVWKNNAVYTNGCLGYTAQIKQRWKLPFSELTCKIWKLHQLRVCGA